MIVMGTGGVGGYFGGRLASYGEDVTFIARGEHLHAIREHGLQVYSPHHGDLVVKPAQVTDDPREAGPVDLVMLSVKSWDTEEAGKALQPVVRDNTAVISFQNGVDNEEKLSAILGRQHVMGGAAYVESTISEPGVIHQQSAMAKLVFGELDGRVTPRAEAFLNAYQNAGIDAELSTNIQTELWSKFLFICALSGMTSLIRTPIGPILQDPDTRQMFADCMREVKAVARAQGISLPEGIVEERLTFADRLLPEMKSSMQRDLERGHRLELDALNGTVVRLGRELGVDVPVNHFIYAALKLHAG
ncbi:MAG: 2-dehydropantoate 2-reductase [Candidatus Bipolaricaulia bacterium]